MHESLGWTWNLTKLSISFKIVRFYYWQFLGYGQNSIMNRVVIFIFLVLDCNVDQHVDWKRKLKIFLKNLKLYSKTEKAEIEPHLGWPNPKLDRARGLVVSLISETEPQFGLPNFASVYLPSLETYLFFSYLPIWILISLENSLHDSKNCLNPLFATLEEYSLHPKPRAL